MLHDETHAIVIDPGDAVPVLQVLQDRHLSLAAILITHHHSDHVGGVPELRQHSGCPVYGPAQETMPEPLTRLADGAHVQALGLDFQVLDVPGHTAGHIAYYCTPAGATPLLFCGDTLFSGGCGRLFEGTPAQMLHSLDRLSALPDDTRICCAHEYTLSNLQFACAVEPDNATLLHYSGACQKLRAAARPTLPALLSIERAINPFLRAREPQVALAAQGFQADIDCNDATAVFAALRQWKNEF